MVRYFTREGLEKIKKELDYLENVKRKEIAERLKHAASFGDLTENAAYSEAKEAQGFLEGRIAEMRAAIAEAQLIDDAAGGTVQLGSRVLLLVNNTKEEFQIVGPDEADVMKGRISHQSPLGSALMGRIKGDKIRFNAPAGETEYTLLEIR